jgi:hypothetical protein
MPAVTSLIRAVLALLIVAGVVAGADADAARADGFDCDIDVVTGDCVVMASLDPQPPTGMGSNSNAEGGKGESFDQIVARKRAAHREAVERYEAESARYEQCLRAATIILGCTPPDPVPLEGIATLTRVSRSAPLITPGQAGAIAVARLHIPLNPPKVGPDPKVNKWKMAAVGYPLWVWAEGPTHLGPVRDSVGGLAVSLDAELTKTVFRMGDGRTVTCRGAGVPYAKSVSAGTPSPDCGYRYEQPSLPKGDYTVTAISYWAVTWTINGTSGVIAVPRQASASLPVGEVQVLVR